MNSTLLLASSRLLEYLLILPVEDRKDFYPLHRLDEFCLPRHQGQPSIMQQMQGMGLPSDLGKRASIRIAFGLVTAGIRIEAERLLAE